MTITTLFKGITNYLVVPQFGYMIWIEIIATICIITIVITVIIIIIIIEIMMMMMIVSLYILTLMFECVETSCSFDFFGDLIPQSRTKER